jgi:uncharacterized protein (DUF433 family)
MFAGERPVMKVRTRHRVVTSLDEAIANIATYTRGVETHQGLAARIKQHPAWYAARDNQGRWMFGPSKFVGYYGADAGDYLASYDRRDGREAEPALANWFVQVDLQSALGRELWQEFIRFAERFGKTPNSRWRVSVPEEELIARAASERRTADADVARRIAYDPDICGGRPRIAGTRVRVSDIVAALAEGASVSEILQDFPYLSAEDISAALNYAAKAVDHRILKAA